MISQHLADAASSADLQVSQISQLSLCRSTTQLQISHDPSIDQPFDAVSQISSAISSAHPIQPTLYHSPIPY